MLKWFKTLSPTMQFVIVIVAVIVVWLIFRNLRGFTQNIGNRSELLGEETALIAQGQQRTYTTSQYNSMASQLYYAMKGWGTDYATVGNVFNQIQNELDVIALDKAFGVRDGYDLQAWLRGDLSAKNMERYVNGPLASKGITKRY